MNRSDSDSNTRLLAATFLDDPLMRWLFPDPAARPAALTAVFDLFLHTGEVRSLSSADELRAVAVWASPAERDLPAPAEPAPVLISAVDRLADLDRLLGERYPTGRDHRYLRVIGTRLEDRGHGHGETLLRQGLAEWDAAGLPTYLEASSPRNADLYARNGFTSYGGPVRLPEGPELYPMWRDAHSSSTDHSTERSSS